MEALKTIRKGALTTIQDLGRYGYMKYGVSVSGAMDRFALRVGNVLVGNDEGAAGIEATVIGPKFVALSELKVAFTGADLSPEINGIRSPMWSGVNVKEGDVISFGVLRSGCRAYVCISGGIDVPLTLSSRSTHVRTGLGGFGRALIQGDIIHVKKVNSDVGKVISSNKLANEHIPIYSSDWLVRVVLGPQNEYFTPMGIRTFFEAEYTIDSESDRMGYRLSGRRIEHKGRTDIITDATPPGSVEVPGSGMPIILMADALTSGGYPKIAAVITVDQDKLAQAKPGDKIKFEKVSITQAHKLLADMEHSIKQIRSSVTNLA